MIKFRNYLHYLDEEIYLFGLEKNLRKIYRRNPKLFKKLENRIDKSTYYYWLEGKSPVALEFLRQITSSNKEWDNIFNLVKYFSSGRKICTLPKNMDNKLSYLIGVLHGDGSFHKNHRYITVTTESKDFLINVINSLFVDIFGVSGSLIELNEGRYYRLEIGNRVIHSFLSMFCPVGRKKGKLNVPIVIKNNRTLLKEYLSGLFDTDGCLTHVEEGRKTLFSTFTQADRNFIFQVDYCLNILGIKTNGPKKWKSVESPTDKRRTRTSWRIYIGSKITLLKLINTLEFRNPLKAERARIMKEILSGPTRI